MPFLFKFRKWANFWSELVGESGGDGGISRFGLIGSVKFRMASCWDEIGDKGANTASGSTDWGCGGPMGPKMWVVGAGSDFDGSPGLVIILLEEPTSFNVCYSNFVRLVTIYAGSCGAESHAFVCRLGLRSAARVGIVT